MKLDPQDRQQVAESLWDSLGIERDLPEATELDFAAETSQRRDEVVSGKVATISHQDLKRLLGR